MHARILELLGQSQELQARTDERLNHIIVLIAMHPCTQKISWQALFVWGAVKFVDVKQGSEKTPLMPSHGIMESTS